MWDLVKKQSGGMKGGAPGASNWKTRAGSALAKGAATRAAGAVSTLGQAAVNAIGGELGVRFDPAPAYLFIVEMGGLIVAEFTECSGLEMEREVYEYEEGGYNNFVRKLPGRSSYSNIVLRRGVTVSPVLYSWYQAGVYNAYVLKLNFSIILGAPMQGTMFDGFAKIKHWDVEGAFPVRWTGPEMSTSSGETAIEEIEIAHHGLTLSVVEASSPFNPIAMALAGDF
ncbi:MAG: phage tail protein [Anaerolineae bacterium]|nr:phage tail protein [Anaerolineae bacterium]